MRLARTPSRKHAPGLSAARSPANIAIRRRTDALPVFLAQFLRSCRLKTSTSSTPGAKGPSTTRPPGGLNTRCVHAAHAPDAATGAIAEPIYLTTTFERDADGGYPRGYRYGREGSPNRTALESCVAVLE